jgi:SAM-dependent methyltransferase
MQPLARGHFEAMHPFEGGIVVAGWILNPDTPAEAIRVLRNGVPVAEGVPAPRDDLAAAFPHIAHARHAGFFFRIDAPAPGAADRITVLARVGQTELGRLETRLCGDLDTLPTPPPALIQRVNGSRLAMMFHADGLRCALEMTAALARHRPFAADAEVLDWGCGCGRLAMHIRRLRLVPALAGCDIDAEAVAYSRTALPGFDATAIPLDPPTPYANGRFGAVIGYSVLSHLDPAGQRAWLGELRRILAPGGLIAVSVHGRFAARFALPAALPDFDGSGFHDGGEDLALGAVAPRGYYRGVFQTPAWTRSAWADAFEVLEHREGGVLTYQDLVVARRRD